MRPTDEISSTGKLLDLIQKGKDPEGDDSHSYASRTAKTRIRRSYINRLFNRKGKIGIYFGYRDISLIKICPDSKGSWETHDYRNGPIDFEDHRKLHDASKTLKKILMEFCGNPKNSDIWCLMSSSNVEIRNIRIPKVPKNQIGNVVKWTIKKEIKYSENDSILDFEIRDEVNDGGILKISVMACIVPRAEVNDLKNLFSGAGYPLKGISIASFAIQNLFRFGILRADKIAGSVFIGEDWSNIDIFSSGNLAFSRSIKTGINGVVDALSEYLNSDEKKGFSIPTNLITNQQSNERLSKSILLTMSRNEGKSSLSFSGKEIKETELYDVITPPIDRLIRQLERSFEHHAMFIKEGDMGIIYLAGEIYGYCDLNRYVSEQIGIPAVMIDLPVPGSFKPGTVMLPDNMVDRACFVPAFSIALSDNSRTPNFLYTYESKGEKDRVKRIDRMATLIFILLSLISIAFFIHQGYLYDQKKNEIKSLRHELEKYSPRVDIDTVNLLVTRIKAEQDASKKYAKRYLGLAIITELSNLTPPGIKLRNLNVILNEISNTKATTVEKNITIEGSVSRNDQGLESALAEYILSLENSPLFFRPVILNNEREAFNGEETLMFTLKLAINLG